MSASRKWVGTQYIRKPPNWAIWEEWLARDERPETNTVPSAAEQAEEIKIQEAIERLESEKP
jgi:hypothetical protein